MSLGWTRPFILRLLSRIRRNELRHAMRRYACVACTLSDHRRNIERVLYLHVAHAHTRTHTFIKMRDTHTYFASSSWHAFRMEKRIASRATVLSSTCRRTHCQLPRHTRIRVTCKNYGYSCVQHYYYYMK